MHRHEDRKTGAEAQRRTSGEERAIRRDNDRMRTIQFHPRGASAVEQEHVRRGTPRITPSFRSTHAHTPSASTSHESHHRPNSFLIFIPPRKHHDHVDKQIHIYIRVHIHTYLSKHKRNTRAPSGNPLLTNSLSLSPFSFSFSPPHQKCKKNSPSLLGSNTPQGISARG